jgi:FAD:protein FMN transferase
VSAAGAQGGRTHVEHVMGTAVSIDIRQPGDREVDAAIAEVVAWLHWVDAVFSTFKSESAVSRIADGRLALSDAAPEVVDVLALADDLHRRTDGWFDVTAGGRFDPSGVVKGWAVEHASALLAARGLADHCVNAGGDLRARGRPAPGQPWRVGIAHPLVHDALSVVIGIDDGAVATSGTAERGAHVFDPFTGRAALDLASVTVVGPDVTTADAYATAALAMGLTAPAWLDRLDGYDAWVVDAAGYCWWNDGFARRLVLPARPPPST